MKDVDTPRGNRLGALRAFVISAEPELIVAC